MTKLITSLVLAASVFTGIAAANAAPRYNEGIAERAQQGAFSPHGIFDGR